MGTGITGVQASGHTPTWIFPLADLTTPITDETTEIPLSVITGAVGIAVTVTFRLVASSVPAVSV